MAMGVAIAIEVELSLFCKRIAIAGSLRRKKESVGDIEVLFVGNTATRSDKADMFASVEVNLADEAIATLEKKGVLERRKNVNGIETYGPKNKLMRHVVSGIPVDFFSTMEPCWMVALVIRTGSKETNLKLTTGAIRLGRRLHAYGEGVSILEPQIIDGVAYNRGDVIKARNERDVFELCGVKYLEPEQR